MSVRGARWVGRRRLTNEGGCGAVGTEERRWLTHRAVEKCTFDRARLIRHNRILAKNGIAPDGKGLHKCEADHAGTPLDRKAVTRL